MTAAENPLLGNVHAFGPADAPVVVLLHSIATSSAMWFPQVPIWAQRFRVLNIDLPGHGAASPSGVPLTFTALASGLVTLLDAHSIEHASIVGLSLGGMIAQAMAIGHPDRLRSVVLAHTTAKTSAEARELWDARITAVAASGIESQVDGTLERCFTSRFREESPLTMAWIEQLIRSTDDEGFISAARAIRSLDHLDALETVDKPALIIAGGHDKAAPIAAAEAMESRLRDADLRLLDSAHLGNIEQATRFTEVVGEFLARTA